MTVKIILPLISLICLFIIIIFIFYCFLAMPQTAGTKNIIVDDFSYKSSLDETSPIYATVCYKANETLMPVVVIMHEYSKDNDRHSLLRTAMRFAKQDFFVLMPDMRGRGAQAELNMVLFNSNKTFLLPKIKKIFSRLFFHISRLGLFSNESKGMRDSGGKETHDILDAIEATKKQYEGNIDNRNINIIGYSGGGGNVLALINRAPNYFNVAVSYFGISNYQSWFESAPSVEIKKQLLTDINGTPKEVPLKFLVRNSLLTAGNNSRTKLFLFADSEDPIVPADQSALFHKQTRNSQLFISYPKDGALRYMHGRPSEHPSLINSEDHYIVEMKSSPDNSDAQKGEFIALGFLYLNNFTIKFGAGDDSIFKVEWENRENGLRISPTLLKGRANGEIIFHGEYAPEIINSHTLQSVTNPKGLKRFPIASGQSYRIESVR